MKTYKFLAWLDGLSGELDSFWVARLNNNYNYLWLIKAERITTARKMALAELQRLAKRTKLPWILMEKSGSIIGKADGRSSEIGTKKKPEHPDSHRLERLVEEGKCVSTSRAWIGNIPTSNGLSMVVRKRMRSL